MPTLEYTQDDLISVSGVVTDANGNPVNLTGAQSLVWKMWRRIDGQNIISTSATPGNQSTTPGSISYTGDANDLSEPSIYAGQFTVKTAGGEIVSWPDPAYVIDVATNPQAGPVPPPQIPVNGNIGKFLQTIDNGMGGAAFAWADTDASGLPAEITARIAGDYQAWRVAKLREGYREVAEALRTPGIIPTVTLSTGAAGGPPPSQISGAVLTLPLDANNLADGTPFLYLGASQYSLAYGASGFDVTNIRPRVLTGSAVTPPWSVRFGISGVSQFEFITKQISGNPSYRLRIDGQWVTEGGVYLNQTLGFIFGALVSGLDTGAHTIQIDFANGMWFGGIYTAPQAEIWKPANPHASAVLLSDSTGGGANAGSSQGTTGVDVWWQRVCDLLGWADSYNASVGGTGMIEVGQSLPFIQRVAADVTGVGADVIVISGSRNDHVDDPNAVATAAATLYSTVKAQNPNALIIAIGPWIGVSTTSDFISINTVVRTAALAAGIPFVDMWTGLVYDASGNIIIKGESWVTGTGWVTSPVGTSVYLRNNFDTGQANGAAITTGNSGGGSQNDQFNSVTGAPTYDTGTEYNGHPSMLTQIGTIDHVAWNTSYTTGYLRFYLKVPASPASTDQKIAWSTSTVPSSNGNLHRIILSANGKLYINVDGANSVFTTNVLPAGTWIRIEAQLVVNGTTASITLKTFNSPESNTASETITTSNADVATLISTIHLGVGQSSNIAYDLAAFEVNNAGYPGPVTTESYVKAGSSDWIMGPDAVHPTLAGHQYWARRANHAFRAIINSMRAETS